MINSAVYVHLEDQPDLLIEMIVAEARYHAQLTRQDKLRIAQFVENLKPAKKRFYQAHKSNEGKI